MNESLISSQICWSLFPVFLACSSRPKTKVMAISWEFEAPKSEAKKKQLLCMVISVNDHDLVLVDSSKSGEDPIARSKISQCVLRTVTACC
jgi:hypothetical protein